MLTSFQRYICDILHLSIVFYKHKHQRRKINYLCTRFIKVASKNAGYTEKQFNNLKT